MPRPTKEERLARVHEEALREFDVIQSTMRDERLQCLQDRRFVSIPGAQWEGPLEEEFERKPKFEINKIAGSVTRIDGEHRNNRCTVDFIPKDGGQADTLADVCDGLYRADEQDSVADEAYDNAFTEAVAGGFGAFRLRCEYVDEEGADDDRQRIVFEPITDADSCVFFDLNAKRQDKADAKSCFVLIPMTREAFEDEWGVDPASVPKVVHQTEFDWVTADVVYVAEYYRVEEVKKTIHVFRLIDGKEERYSTEELDADDGALRHELAVTGARELRQKKIKQKKVHKYLLSGSRVLEDCDYVAGRCIPVVPVYGRRFFVDGIERCMGHVRLAKDAQRLKNMLTSWLAELSALSSVEVPIVTPQQIANHQVMWSEMNRKRYPYLLLNAVQGTEGEQTIAGPIGYTKVPQIPPAIAALLQLLDIDLKDLLGNFEQGEKVTPNISGKAIELIQQSLDRMAFLYIDNFKKAMHRAGEIWLSKAKDVYIEDGRMMKTLALDGKASSVELNRPMVADDGATYYENDLSTADFDVAVDVGPSTSSKRAAIVRALSQLLLLVPQDDVETRAVLISTIISNLEGEGLQPLREFYRQKLVRMGVEKPTEEEQQQLEAEAAAAAQRQDPQAQLLAAAAQEAEAKAAKARADTVETVASADLKRAQTQKTIAETVSIRNPPTRTQP